MANIQHRVLIVGGGTAGITVAASLKRRAPGTLDIAIVEPAEFHYYQPAFTLVGAGVLTRDETRRTVASLVPAGVKLIRAAAEGFEPEHNRIRLSNGDTATYEYLVVCTGVRLDWEKVEGLSDTLGRNGVCSNFSPDHVPYTRQCMDALKDGGTAVFTQPPLPFKCPGAPQKIVYLTADDLRRRGLGGKVSLRYFVHAPVIFGVPYFARELIKVAARYGVETNYLHNLVAVDGGRKVATFEIVDGEKKGQRIEAPFDMLHVSPHQSAPAVIKSSPLANAAGWIDVNQNTMQHTKFSNVFSLGDVCSSPNSKTAAAVRKQSPVVVRNILNAMASRSMEAGYDGYASCPLTTAFGKAIIAEFIYGGKVTPTLWTDPSKETSLGWWIKKTGLPILYWNYMLKGREAFPKHNKAFAGDVAPKT